jgi:hypothetical protein
VVVLLLLAGGCGYYNGMYNAKRIAGQARKAEREGRTMAASSLWGQLAVKAESVAVQHPRKSWSAEARLLQGMALVKLGSCERGLRPLESAMASTENRDVAEQAAVLIGGCRLNDRDLLGATEVFGRLLTSRDPDRRSLALYQHGRGLRLLGRNEDAAAELGRSRHPAARGERAAALAGLGRLPEARALTDSMLTRPDTLTPWQALLAALAAADAEGAGATVDRLTAAPEFPSQLKARLLLEDGLRWLASDTLRGERRLAQADSASEGSPLQTEVQFFQAQALLRRARTPAGLEQAAVRLEQLDDDAGSFGAIGTRLGIATRRVLAVADSTPAGSPRGDLRLFLAGELARDSVGARYFAADQFRRVASEWPDSPFAAKAVLALIELQPETADSLREALLARYPGNPYVTMAQGGEAPEYAVLEDSLRLYLISFRSGAREGSPRPRQPGRPRPQQPPTPRQPADVP